MALPLGELSPQATERVFGSYVQRLPSPSSLRSDTSPKGRGKSRRLTWLSLWESCRRRRLRGLWRISPFGGLTETGVFATIRSEKQQNRSGAATDS